MMKSEDMSIDDLVGHLLHEEACLEQEHPRLASAQPKTAALTVNRSTPRSQNSFNNSGSVSSSASRNPDTRRCHPVCKLCNKQGHEAIDCWQRGNQTDFPSCRQNPRQQPRYAHLTQQHSPSTTDPTWYSDTEATDHVSPDFTKLNVADEYKGDDKLQVGNGNHLSISHVGSSFLPNLKLRNVFIVPELTKTLLSVSKLTADNNIYMEFWPHDCNVKTLQGQTILTGDVNQGLYRLP
ncbi:hypothetical protein LXL04_037187 [Taraxacum kok-saghyz]